MAWDRLIRGGTLVTGGGLSRGDLAIALVRTVPPEIKR